MADVNINKYRASVVRSGSTPATPGFVVSEGQNPVEPAGSEQNHLPVTINATANALAITTDQVLSGAGTVGQYIRGDGSLADFPASTGGGSSVSYYLNGSISQGTIGGVAYKELSKTPILGAGTNFTINANGYIASFLTDAGDPNLLEIPGGNWNFETYFSASSGGGSPTFYVELYKYDGSTFTLIASNSGSPELIAFGTNVNSYFSTLAVPTTALTLTDRLAIRYYVTHSGRTITLHTENNTLCQIITTFTTGLTALNGLTAQVQYFAVGTSGTDFNIASATQTHTFNLPTASASNRGALSSADWSTFNAKQNALTLTTTGSSGASTLVGATLNVPTYTLSGLGGVPTSRQLTINGTAFDLSADRSWSVGTVTSVGLSSASSGVTIGNTPVTGSGTITLAIATATSTQQGLLSSTDWSTFNNKQNALTLTTTGTSGAATLVGATLNIPQYQAAGTYVTSVTASSPLASSGGTTPNITIQQASGSQSGFLSSTDWTTFNNKQNALTNPVTGTGTTNYLPKFTGASTIGNSNLINDASGNLGLGVTPNSTMTVIRSMQLGYSGIIAGQQGTAEVLYLGSNWYFDGAFRYQNNGFATRLLTSQGAYEWSTASSGTAGNAISFTQAMTLDASGNLLIGATSNISSARREIVIRGANGSLLSLGNNTTADRFQIVSDSGENALLNNKASTPMIFYTSNTEAMRISSSQNLLVGTTSDNGARLQVSGTATVSSNLTVGNGTTSVSLAINRGSSANGNGLRFQTASNNEWYIGSAATSTNTDLEIYNHNTATTNLRLAYSTGAATFSGSVTAGADILTPTRVATDTINGYTGGSTPLTIQTGGAQEVRIGTNATTRLTISSTGAATFSGKVGVGGAAATYSLTAYNASNGTTAAFGGTARGIRIDNDGTFSSGRSTIFGVDSSFYGSYQPLSIEASSIALQAVTGGNVLIGNTSAYTSRLTVQAAAGNRPAIKAGFGASAGNGYWVLGDNYTLDESLTSYGIDYSSGDLVLGSIVAPSTTTSGAFISTQAQFGNLGSAIRAGNSGDIYFFRGTSTSVVAVGGAKSMTESMRLNSSGNLLIGTTTDNGAKLNVNGTIRTANPTGSTSDGWLLGRALVSGSSTPDRWIRVQIGNLYYDILSRYIGSV